MHQISITVKYDKSSAHVSIIDQKDTAGEVNTEEQRDINEEFRERRKIETHGSLEKNKYSKNSSHTTETIDDSYDGDDEDDHNSNYIKLEDNRQTNDYSTQNDLSDYFNKDKNNNVDD